MKQDLPISPPVSIGLGGDLSSSTLLSSQTEDSGGPPTDGSLFATSYSREPVKDSRADSHGGAGSTAAGYTGFESTSSTQRINGIDRLGVDLTGPVMRYMTNGIFDTGNHQGVWLKGHTSWIRDSVPVFADMSYRTLGGVCPFLAHTCMNKSRAICSTIKWFPDGRKVLSGTQMGELAVWNGKHFSFEDIKRLPLGGGAVTAMVWSPSEEHLYAGDTLGHVIILNLALSHIQDTAFTELFSHSIVDLSVSPSGYQLSACADGAKPVVWDVTVFQLQRFLQAPNVDTLNTSCLEWHPEKNLVATGSRTQWVYLWDPREENPVVNLQAHKHALNTLRWSNDCVSFATCSKDTLVKIWDLRFLGTATHIFRLPPPVSPVVSESRMSNVASDPDSPPLKKDDSGAFEMQAADGNLVSVCAQGGANPPEPTCCAWNPVDTRVLATGDKHGNLCYWSTLMSPTGAQRKRAVAGAVIEDAPSNAALVQVVHAHGGAEREVWQSGATMSGVTGGAVQSIEGMDWHPMGHVLATTGDDRAVRFWCRSPPGFLKARVIDGYSLAGEHGSFPISPLQTPTSLRQMAEETAQMIWDPLCPIKGEPLPAEHKA